jgi:hypothetical protein
MLRKYLIQTEPDKAEKKLQNKAEVVVEETEEVKVKTMKEATAEVMAEAKEVTAEVPTDAEVNQDGRGVSQCDGRREKNHPQRAPHSQCDMFEMLKDWPCLNNIFLRNTSGNEHPRCSMERKHPRQILDSQRIHRATERQNLMEALQGKAISVSIAML